MSSLQLNSDGSDILITNNRLTLTNGLEAIRQHLQTKLRMFLGEWFLDNRVGVPWFQEVLKKNASLIVVREILKDQILGTQGIIQLLNFTMDFISSNRVLVVAFKCLSTEGEIDFSLPVEV